MSIYSRIIDIQKLNQAWNHVRKNHPAAGADGVSYEDFDNNIKNEIYSLNRELVNNSYELLPVKETILYKGEKTRQIALFCMRDKVIQQTLADELSKIYDPRFSDSTYAYRNGRSSLLAIERIEEASKKYDYVLKLDITKFFDNINQSMLIKMLQNDIHEEDVIDLVKKMLQAKILDARTGSLNCREKGVFQGASIAPVLSNIYLMTFDKEMEKECEFFIRYSDDMVILGSDIDRLKTIRQNVENMLKYLSLSISQEKSFLGKTEDGFTFLGYQFDKVGKHITDKAESTLKERLEIMWMTSINNSVEEKLKKGSEILGGWEQYYREKRVPGEILEYAVKLFMVQNKDRDLLLDVIQSRFQYDNIYKDLLYWFVDFWERTNNRAFLLKEYEQFFGVEELDADIQIDTASALFTELLDNYKKLLISNSKEVYENIVQLYSDCCCYNRASYFQKEMNNVLESNVPIVHAAKLTSEEDVIEWEPEQSDLAQYNLLFVGREDLYAIDEFENGRRTTRTVYEALTEEVLRKHLRGEITAATYVQRSNATASYLVLDIDISKKILLQHSSNTEIFNQYLEKCCALAQSVNKKMQSIGIRSYIERSGYRGFHLWFFFSEWIPMRFVITIQNYIDSIIRKEKIMEEGNEITIEYFPNKSKPKPDKPGQCIKLPYGIHTKTGKSSCFLDKDMNPVTDFGRFMRGIARYSLKTVKKVIGAHMQVEKEDISENTLKDIKELESDISCFGLISESVREVLIGCTLMRYLCLKAKNTGYLGHFERLSVLYVFGHIGDEGKEFVHKIMQYTINYQYNITNKFILKLPEKPISCLKLRDQYKTVTAEYGCSCNFRRTKNCYPSPVLHAIRNSTDEVSSVTVPVSRTLSKSKEKEVYDELNVSKKIQELASRVVELKKQKRGIDKSIEKIEKEFEEIFDAAGVDSMEIQMGILVRKKSENGYEWSVEL